MRTINNIEQYPKCKGMNMKDKRRSCFDRRNGNDRRRVYNLDYFLGGGIERRRRNDRRSSLDRRSGWMRVGQWYSVHPSMLSLTRTLAGIRVKH